MKEFQHQLIEYSPQNTEEIKFKLKMQKLMDSLGELSFRRESIEAHFTASAWLIDIQKGEVLLLHHKKLNKWLQPGGHADGVQDLQKVALKEVSEETGLTQLKPFVRGIFDLDIHLIPEYKDIPAHHHYDVRYAFSVIDGENTQINNESKAFKWLSLDEVPKFTDNTSILRMMRKTKELLIKK